MGWTGCCHGQPARLSTGSLSDTVRNSKSGGAWAGPIAPPPGGVTLDAVRGIYTRTNGSSIAGPT